MTNFIRKVNNCNYTYNLFRNPLCSDQSLIIRLLNIVFHILTLCIPLIIYWIISCYYGFKISHSVSTRSLIYNIFPRQHDHQQDQIKIHLPLSDLGQDILQFVESLNADHKDEDIVDDCGLKAFGAPYCLVELSSLESRYYKELISLIKKYPFPDNPWDKEEVVHIADICFKISFAISFLTLNDISRFKNKNETDFDVIMDGRSYVYMTMLFIGSAYHRARSFMYWDTFDSTISGYEPGRDAGGIMHENGLTAFAESEKMFYIDGNIQNTWRLLYNEYSLLLHSMMPSKDFLFEDMDIKDRYLGILEWTKLDLDLEEGYVKPKNTTPFSNIL